MIYHEFSTNPILILVLSIGLNYLGYGPFSLKRNPKAGVAFTVVGFFFRFAGALLLVWDIFLLIFMISMIM
jgi:hypothetical protein